MTEVLERVWAETWGEWDGDWRAIARHVALAPFRRRTYRNLCYLLFWLPTGAIYVTFLITGIAVGVATLIILIGFPILLVVIAVASWANGFERELAWRWLGVEIPPAIRPEVGRVGLRHVATAYFRDQVTWTNLLFLLLKLPVGGLLFFLITWSITTTTRLLIEPLLPGARADRWIGLDLMQFGSGVLLGFTFLHGVNAAAYLSGRFARLMLGPSEAALRVVESEAEAARERANAARAEQSRRELMVNVSHELRTPVASIRGHVESLMIAVERDQETQTHLEPEHLHNYLGIVHRETERLGALVDDLLALARSEAGELRLVLRPIAASQVVREVHETLAPLAWRDRQVELIQDAPDGLPMVMADRDRLSQVLLNLVRNAITHTPPGGLVSIALALNQPRDRAEPAHLTLSVADTGNGIPPEDLEKIFERFYRVDESRARVSGGFGLGLSIVKDLVDAMGGTISVSSAVGEGSLFQVCLRVAPNPNGTGDRPSVKRGWSPLRRGVDDHENT